MTVAKLTSYGLNRTVLADFAQVFRTLIVLVAFGLLCLLIQNHGSPILIQTAVSSLTSKMQWAKRVVGQNSSVENTDESSSMAQTIFEAKPAAEESMAKQEAVKWNSSAPKLTIGCNPAMGLGNKMFTYASLYGLARFNDRNPFMDDNGHCVLYDYFTLGAVPKWDSKGEGSGYETAGERACCKTDNALFKLPQRNLALSGYFQSYRYFELYSDQIRAEFSFQPQILAKCEHRIRMALAPRRELITSCVLVAVHIRRGDFTRKDKMQFGHMPAREDYLKKAVTWFRNKFNSTSCLRFLVLGNDVAWNRAHMPDDNDIVILDKSPNAIDDFCVLVKCNHTLGTTGTFSWWAGFLTNGTVTYQGLYVRPGSSLSGQYNAYEFFLPHWIPL